jgi:hypothetical protein
LSPSFRSPHQNPVCTSLLPHICYMHRPSHSSRFDYPNNYLTTYSDVCCRWFTEGQTTSRPPNPSSNLIPKTVRLTRQNTRNNVLCQFCVVQPSKHFIFASWIVFQKFCHPGQKLHLGLRGTH